jgi:hypothetical protein
MTLYKDTYIVHLSTRSQSGKVMNISSNDKSDMLFTVPALIDMTNENILYAEYSIDYALIPISFYNINSSNNTFSIQLYANSPYIAVAKTLYTIPVGNYSALSLITWFNATFAETANTSAIILSFNAVNSIFSTTSQQPFQLTSTTSDYIFGYSSTTGIIDNYTFPRMCNFLPTPRINIRCRELNNGRMLSMVNSDEITVCIPNNYRPNQQILYTNTTNIKSIVKIDTLNTFRIRITDDDNNLIQFNGVSCFFNLRFDIYYKTIPKLPSFKHIVNLVNTESYRKLLNDIERNKHLILL